MKVETFKRFFLKMKLERFLLVRLHDESTIFYSAENAHAYESGPLNASAHELVCLCVLRETAEGIQRDEAQ